MASEDTVKVDAIVVGGGPAGLSAALTLAQQNQEVILIERGEYSGAKNVGGLVYGTVLNTLIPSAFEKAPIERPVSKRSIGYLGEGQHATLVFGSDEWTQAPYNNTYVVNRSQFDKWFASQVEEAGASLLEGMLVDDLIYEGEGTNKRVTGVKLRGDEFFYADAVILAEGANCLVTEKCRKELNLKSGKHLQDFAVGVKEIISLPREVIENRFHLNENEGAALDFMGLPFEGLIGGGFIYTAKEALHVGVVAKIETLVKSRRNPNEIMDGFKQHPLIRKYLKDGELVEYSAHMLPEGGYSAIGDLTGNGVMIAGDAAGLLNMSLYKEGTNHAMESGKWAAKAVIDAREKGDFSKNGLSSYEANLNESIVLNDLKKYAGLPDTLEKCPNLLSLYPQKFTQLLVDYFTVTEESKSKIQKKAFKNFKKGLPKLKFIRDIIRARKLM